MKNKKGFAHILILVIIIIIALVATIAVIFEPKLIYCHLACKNGFYIETKYGNIGYEPDQTYLSRSPTPVVTDEADTSGWKTYLDETGFQIKYPPDWDGLTGPCVKISILSSKSTDQIYQYLQNTGGWGQEIDIKTIEKQILEDHQLREEYFIDFANIRPEHVTILGAQGQGEINNVFIKSPTGYYHIAVVYRGPVPDTNRICIGDKEDEYKQILSTFEFTGPPLEDEFIN